MSSIYDFVARDISGREVQISEYRGPTGVSKLVVRLWGCSECGAEHDRDVNAARNILYAGLRCRASVRGNEPSHDMIPVEQDTPVLARYGWGACYVAA